MYDLGGGSVVARRLCQFSGYYNLQLFNSVRNLNSRTLDLILSNLPVVEVTRDSVPLVPEDLVHHPALSMNLIVDTPHDQQMSPGIHSAYDFRRADYFSLYEMLRDSDWSGLYQLRDVDEAVDFFYGVIHSCFDATIPKKIINGKGSKYPPWFTAEIIRLLKKKNRYARKKNFSDYHKNQFLRLRRDVKALIAVAYQTYVNCVQINIRNNSKEFWKFANGKHSAGDICEKMVLDVEVFIGSEVPAGFAAFFQSVYTPITACYGTEVDDNFQHIGSIGGLNISSSSEQDILLAIKSLKPRTSPGPDGIPSFVVKGCGELLVGPLKYLLDLSLRMSHFPSKW
ncbi:uncharacterized protein LOC111047572 [Nilaparvata lugens]|uniref:uncharacterized protein LOC111047572 n=1 Tax=Nilaparvata lugens TaxID=108931 RepID=UPI00193DF436|nr:uncharacterized protein LOC111047572 [Nilaparvata lugens]